MRLGLSCRRTELKGVRARLSVGVRGVAAFVAVLSAERAATRHRAAVAAVPLALLGVGGRVAARVPRSLLLEFEASRCRHE